MSVSSLQPLVLVVDDEPMNLQVVGAGLVMHGFRVGVALDGPAALEAAFASPPDVVLRAAEAGHKHAVESGGNRVSTMTASKSGAPAPAAGKPGAAGASASPAPSAAE